MLVGVVVLFAILAAMSDVVWFFLNIMEFGALYLRPIYFTLIGGLVLAAVALVRVDFRNRRSLTWWALRLLVRVLRQRGVVEGVPADYFDFKTFRMTPFNFAAWQATKAILGMLVFGNLLFGLSIYAMAQGWNPGLGQIWGIFSLPFVNPPPDQAYAQAKVIPLMPALTLIVTPILGAIGARLTILVGATQMVRVLMPTAAELGGETRQWGWRIGIIEGLIALALFWAMFNSFFPSFIDYNTKYAIAGLAAAGTLFAFFSYLDLVKGKGLFILARRRILTRFVAVLLIVLVVGSVMAVNNNIADAKKVEWLGPYTAQQIGVNRYLAELDEVREIPYNFSITPIPREAIDAYGAENQKLLSKVRLWDWGAAFAKLKPEIGLIPYVDYQDSDILRFNGTLYWSASMKPILPETVRPGDRWYAEHLVYTHVPAGFLILDAQEGRIVDSGDFFKQRKIYYGEGGLFEETWAAYPVDRERSDELLGHFYDGAGGLDLPPPLSWIFELNFLLAFGDETVHVMRYKDVFDRVSLLFPYFQYQFEGRRLDMLPVTDGERTYYLMPLIVALNTKDVPWSVGNPFMRLVGYALVDIYDGNIQLLVLGDDYFSELFKTVYSDHVTTEVPDWLMYQMRYPEELFEWRVGMYNYYHVTDPATFIVAKEFFEVPQGLNTYYIIAQPPDFQQPEYVGLLSLELRGALGRNLAGYMIVRNDYDHFGEMNFYEVDIKSPTKLLGPTAVLEALEKNSEFAQLKTLLRQPRIGDNILYRVGEHDVYFIPVYTAGAGGVVTELGVVAAVGAAFTGEYYVGLGSTPEEAFKAFLIQLTGVQGVQEPGVPSAEAELTLNELIRKADTHLEAYLELWAEGKYREAGERFEQFQDVWRQILERLS
jgi:hypothetical protein